MVPSRKRGSERKTLCCNASSAKVPKVKKLYDDNDLKYTILDVINRRTNGKRASLCVERILSSFGFTDSRHSYNKRQGMEISILVRSLWPQLSQLTCSIEVLKETKIGLPRQS
ncbi:hypothetical protein ACFX2J_037056 [Malus domestica]